MKKFKTPLFVFALFLLGGASYWYFTTPPKFEGEYAPLKKRIWEYDHAKSDSDRARIAIFDAAIVDFQKILDENSNLSAQEIKSIEKMQSFRDETLERVKDLFNSFSESDVQTITQDNPWAIPRIVGSLASLGMDRPVCSDEDIQRLADKLGAEKAFESGMNIVMYGSIQDSPYVDGYIHKIRDLLQNDARFTEFRDLDELYLKYWGYESTLEKSLNETFGASKDRGEKLKRHKEILYKIGFKEETLDQEIYELAKVAPNCFLNFFGYVKSMRPWQTQYAGKKLLQKTEAYFTKTGKISTDTYEILEGEENRYRITKDAWNSDFRLEISSGILSVISNGHDRETGTSDDMVIGSITLKK
ncbi:MAG: hypothetical protein AB7O96_10785 [Pseudobdellovibrionaceae bacterium]